MKLSKVLIITLGLMPFALFANQENPEYYGLSNEEVLNYELERSSIYDLNQETFEKGLEDFHFHRRISICLAVNYRGFRFIGRDFTPIRARTWAIRQCHLNSYFPTTCRIVACRWGIY